MQIIGFKRVYAKERRNGLEQNKYKTHTENTGTLLLVFEIKPNDLFMNAGEF